MLPLPRGEHLAISGGIFGCSNCWGESYWNLLGRNQGCCSTFRKTEDSSHYQKYPAPSVNSAKIQKPILSPYVPGELICSSWNQFSCSVQGEPFFPLAPMLSVRHLRSTGRNSILLLSFPHSKTLHTVLGN